VVIASLNSPRGVDDGGGRNDGDEGNRQGPRLGRIANCGAVDACVVVSARSRRTVHVREGRCRRTTRRIS
jgi:hypothetical protein